MEPEFFEPIHELEHAAGVRLDQVQLSRYRPGYPTSALYVDFRLDSVMRRRLLADRLLRRASLPHTFAGMLPLLFHPAQLVAFGAYALLLVSASLLLVAWVVFGFEPLPVELVGLSAVGAALMLRVVSDAFYYKPDAAEGFDSSRAIEEPDVHIDASDMDAVLRRQGQRGSACTK